MIAHIGNGILASIFKQVSKQEVLNLLLDFRKDKRKTMKVLWLSHLIPYPPKGGVLQRTFNMVREVSRYHDVTLICFNQGRFLNQSLPESEAPLEEAVFELEAYVRDIAVFPIPEEKLWKGRYFIALYALLTGRAYNMVWLKSKCLHKELEKLLWNQRFDAVHIDTISLAIYQDIIQGVPTVLNHHNFESEMIRNRIINESSPLKRFYYKVEADRLLKSEKTHCAKADLNLTCSDDDAEEMKNKVGVDTFLSVPNGVDLTYFYPKKYVDRLEHNIVIVGGLSWYPNRDAVEHFLIDIWPLVKSEIPTATVDIIGRNPSDEIIKYANADPAIRVHGFVDDVRDYLWRSQFYLCPIRIGGGTKLKILDALASGTCIIADPFACKGIDVTDGKDVMFANTPVEYVSQMQRLIREPELEESLRSSGPELIRKKYSYDQIGRNYSDHLQKLKISRSGH